MSDKVMVSDKILQNNKFACWKACVVQKWPSMP